MKRFSKNSSRNSLKSLTLKPFSKASEFEGKQENEVPRSLSMEHIHNDATSPACNRAKDFKLIGREGFYDTMISSKTATHDTLSLSHKKKSSSSIPSSPVPSYNDENRNPPFRPNDNNRPKYDNNNVLRNNSNIHNISNNNSSNKPVSSPSILGIENHSFNGTLTTPSYNNGAPGGDNTNGMDRSQAEARLCKLRQELDRKRIFIKNMKMSLDTVDSSDNIDIRIQHAELEYQLGREELNLLNILEEFRNLQNAVENNFKIDSSFHENLSIYNYIIKHSAPSDTITLHAVQIPYDSKSPKFGLSYRDENHGLFVEWTSEAGPPVGLQKGDRILEINNHPIVQNNNRTELMKLLKLLPQTKLVVLRFSPSPAPPSEDFAPPNRQASLTSVPKLDEAEKIQNDNVRLTHRISYLEEQVAELLQKVNKGQTFHTGNNKLSRIKNKYLETSLCSKAYEAKDYPSQRKLETRQLPEDKEEVQVFQKGSKIKTLLKNQKHAKEKLDKVLERTKRYANSGEDCKDHSSHQRHATDLREPEEDTKETRHSLSRKYKTLEKCNPSKYHRRKKSDAGLVGTTGSLKSTLSDTETCAPKIKSKSLIYLNKSQSEYNYPLNSLHGSERSIDSAEQFLDNTLERLSGDRLCGDRTQLYEDDKHRKTLTFPIVKFNSDKNVRKMVDAKIYEEYVQDENSRDSDHRVEYTNSLDRLSRSRNDPCYDELNRKLGVCEPDVKTNGERPSSDNSKVTIQTNTPHEFDIPDNPCERLARLYVVNETNHSKRSSDSRQINNFISDSKEAFNRSNGHGDQNSRYHQRTSQSNSHPYSTSKISIEIMDKNQPGEAVVVKQNRVNGETHGKQEPNNNDLYRIEKAIFNELHEECLSKLDKSQDARRLGISLAKNEQARDNGAEERDSLGEQHASQYDDFVRNKQSLDRIFDKYFQEPDQEDGGSLKDGKHRFYSKQEILKNKFKNEKYVDIDNDNEIPLSKNVEKLNNNFKEFWKIKSYKRNSALSSANENTSEKIEKSQSETTFNDYERKLSGNGQILYPSPPEESRKFNENTRMSKYELDDKMEKEKLQKAFLAHTRSKPIPPKKPARLSLQRAASLQSVNSIASVMTHNSDSQTKKPIKRNYKGDKSYMTVSLLNTSNERWC